MGEFTEALRAIEAGLPPALHELARLAYPELRKLARSRLYASGPDRLLDTTELVHECWLRLSTAHDLKLPDRRHFYAYASKVMRSVIVDEVRSAATRKRSGDFEWTTLSTTALADGAIGDAADVVAPIDQALERLAQTEPLLAQVVEMRFFAGFTETEIAQALGISERTVRRHWDKARLLLAGMLAPGDL
jgi:RNA polymerase sigma factor (TIGR02999 family)